MSLDCESPLGFATFLANSSNHRKVFVPSTYNMSSILKSVKAQESFDLVCDKSFYELDLPLPASVLSDYKDMCSSVKNVVVGGTGSASSKMFSAKSTVIDPLTL